jgi:hypothetical protein
LYRHDLRIWLDNVTREMLDTASATVLLSDIKTRSSQHHRLLRAYDGRAFLAGMTPRLHVVSGPDSDSSVAVIERQPPLPVSNAAEARCCSTRAFYQDAVAAYLSARTEEERSVLGDAMYFAQLATMEARFNAEGCARFRALAELRMHGCSAKLDGAAKLAPGPASPGASQGHDVVRRPREAAVGQGLGVPRAA